MEARSGVFRQSKQQHFKPHEKCGKWKGVEKKKEEKIIINMGKRYKPASKGIFMSLGFLIKISWRLKNKGALCVQAAGEPLSTAS